MLLLQEGEYALFFGIVVLAHIAQAQTRHFRELFADPLVLGVRVRGYAELGFVIWRQRLHLVRHLNGIEEVCVVLQHLRLLAADELLAEDPVARWLVLVLPLRPFSLLPLSLLHAVFSVACLATPTVVVLLIFFFSVLQVLRPATELRLLLEAPALVQIVFVEYRFELLFHVVGPFLHLAGGEPRGFS